MKRVITTAAVLLAFIIHTAGLAWCLTATPYGFAMPVSSTGEQLLIVARVSWGLAIWAAIGLYFVTKKMWLANDNAPEVMPDDEFIDQMRDLAVTFCKNKISGEVTSAELRKSATAWNIEPTTKQAWSNILRRPYFVKVGVTKNQRGDKIGVYKLAEA